MKIVCDDKIPFLKGVFEPYAQVVYLPGAKTTAADVRDADAIVTRTRTKCDESLLAGSKVRMIATATIGFDHIDTEWCESHGISWTNAPGCNSGSVCQYIASVLVSLFEELKGKTLGIIGVGHVGSKVEALARTLGMNVLLNDPPRAKAEGPEGFVSLEELLECSDIVTLHVPLASDTYHLIDSKALAKMNSNQILINSSRGEVVDGDALKTALKEKRLRGAVLDVWEHEPDIDPELLELVNIATPHIAGYSADGKAAGTVASVRAVAHALGIKELYDWNVSDIPGGGEFSIYGHWSKSTEEILREAILHTYDVSGDCAALRGDIGAFESLRSNYPIRREFEAFSLNLTDASGESIRILTELGFVIANVWISPYVF